MGKRMLLQEMMTSKEKDGQSMGPHINNEKEITTTNKGQTPLSLYLSANLNTKGAMSALCLYAQSSVMMTKLGAVLI